MSNILFPKQFVALRKKRGYTQQILADKIGLHVTHTKRYEAGAAQPTLEVLRKFVLALNVSADTMLFDGDERGPDDELRLQFEAISGFNAQEKQIIREVLEGLILKREAKRWATTS